MNPNNATLPRAQGGFTLVELMVVVAVVGVLVSAATVTGTAVSTRDQAHAVGSMLQEGARRAVAGGPVRPDVALAAGTNGRARISVLHDPGTDLSWVLVEVMAEKPLPADGNDWNLVLQRRLPAGVRIERYANAANLSQGALTTALGNNQEFYCYADGTCDPVTLYLASTGSKRREARVALVPLTGTTAVFDGW